MSKELKGCCRTVVKNMVATGGLGSALQVFLAASPFVLILPDLLLPGSASEAAETLAEKLVGMTGEKAVTNVTKTSSLPDFADSVRAVNAITLNTLHVMAHSHSLVHAAGNIDGQLWAEFKKVYSPNGEIRKGGGWDLNPFW